MVFQRLAIEFLRLQTSRSSSPPDTRPGAGPLASEREPRSGKSEDGRQTSSAEVEEEDKTHHDDSNVRFCTTIILPSTFYPPTPNPTTVTLSHRTFLMGTWRWTV